MALKKSIPSNYGPAATYWRISGLQIHDWENVFVVIVSGYADEPTRRAVKEDGTAKFQPLAPGTFRLTADQLAELFPAGLQSAEWPDKTALYEFLKTLPDFAGAKDA